MTPQLTDLVSNTRDLLNAVRGSLIRVAQNLHQIKSDLSPDVNFGSFVEENFGMSQSFASKLLTVNRVYILEGGATPEQLESIDHEKLYLAKDAGGSIEERIAKAQSLSRSDLRAEHQESAPHDFAAKEICATCGATRENHS